MGAVPSRETLGRGLYQVPDYGQKHKMVLVPLTREFFPSYDCLLLRQLFEARKDPFVHYYHTFDEGFPRAQTLRADVGAGNSAMLQGSGCGPAKAARTPTSGASATGAGKWRGDEFVPITCTVEEFYNTYVCRGDGEQILNTDKEMIDLHAIRPDAVRPVPCAIAFAYGPAVTTTEPGSGDVPDVGVAPCADDGDRGFVDVCVEGKVDVDATATTTAEGCTTLSGLRVRVVGFVGDVSSIRSHCCGDTWETGTLQLQMFLNKSVGDHNFVHAFMAAVYTYVAQWHEAVAGVMKSAEGQERSVKCEGVKQGENDCAGGFRIPVNSELLETPPIGSVVISGRRTNVPMLCFQRGLRTMLVRILDLAGPEGTDDAGGMCCGRCGFKSEFPSPTDEVTTGESASAPTRGPLNCGNRPSPFPLGQTSGVQDVLDMWLDDGVVFTRIPRCVVACALRYVARRANCPDCIMDIVRVRQGEGRADSEAEVATLQADTIGRRTRLMKTLHPHIDGSCPHNVANKLVTGVAGDVAYCDRMASATATAAAPLAHQKLHGVESEVVVVESWPNSGIDLVRYVSEQQSPVSLQTHLYWVVGHSVKAQSAAADALELWWASGRPLVTANGNSRLCESCHQKCVGAEKLADRYVSAGELLHLSMDPLQGNGEPAWVLRRTRLPLEELLLSELHNSCKVAREAPPNAPGWVRYSDFNSGQRRETPATSSLGAVNSNTEWWSEFHDAVNELVGEGSLCLWQVVLCTGVVRVIAVTPHFLRPPRKKRVRRKVTRRVRAPKQGGEALQRADAFSPATFPGEVSETKASRARRVVSTPKRTARLSTPIPVPSGTESEGIAKSLEQYAPASSFTSGHRKDDAVSSALAPNFSPVGVGNMWTPQRPCQYTNALPTPRVEPFAFPHGRQHSFAGHGQGVFDVNCSPLLDMGFQGKRPSTPFASRRTSREDQHGVTLLENYNTSRRISSNGTSHRVSISSFTNLPTWDEKGTFWPSAAPEERVSATRHSSVVGGRCTPFAQPTDGYPNFMHHRGSLRDEIHCIPNVQRSVGGFTSSGGCTTESTVNCSCAHFDPFSASTAGSEDNCDNVRTQTRLVNVTVRRGLHH